MNTGVYKITNQKTGKCYIGSAAGSSIEKRWSIHRGHLRNNHHINPHFQRAWNQDGEEFFVFEVLELCEPNRCLAIEQSFIDTYGLDKLYNINPKAESRLGAKHSEEAKQKMSRAKVGRVGVRNGKTHSDSSREKMSIAAKSRYAGEKHPGAKLTDRKVKLIKRALRVGIKQIKIAKRLGISTFTVNAIHTGRQWKHV